MQVYLFHLLDYVFLIHHLSGLWNVFYMVGDIVALRVKTPTISNNLDTSSSSGNLCCLSLSLVSYRLSSVYNKVLKCPKISLYWFTRCKTSLLEVVTYDWRHLHELQPTEEASICVWVCAGCNRKALSLTLSVVAKADLFVLQKLLHPRGSRRQRGTVNTQLPEEPQEAVNSNFSCPLKLCL